LYVSATDIIAGFITHFLYLTRENPILVSCKIPSGNFSTISAFSSSR